MAKSQAQNTITRVLAILRADSAVAAVLGDAESPQNVRVYGHIPDKPDFPYCRVETVRADDFSTADSAGAVTAFRCHVFSQYRGEKECAQAIDAIEDALHDADLSANVAGFIYCLHVRTERAGDPDETIRHFFAEFESAHMA